MRPVLAIARRDLLALLGAPSGWLVLAAFQAMAGAFWLAILDSFVARSQDLIFDPYAGEHLTFTDHLIAPFFGNLVILLLVVVPAVTMRSFADELRQGTIELLASSPLTPSAVVAGKYLGSLGFLAVALLSTAWLPWTAWRHGPVDAGVIAGGYLATVLVAATVVAIGTLASAFTEQATVALVLTFSVSMVLWIVGWIDPDPTSLAAQLSLSGHVQDLTRGALRASDVAYFVLLTGWCLFATRQRVASWRYA